MPFNAIEAEPNDFEAEHGIGYSLNTLMTLLNNVVEMLSPTDFNGVPSAICSEDEKPLSWFGMYTLLILLVGLFNVTIYC